MKHLCLWVMLTFSTLGKFSLGTFIANLAANGIFIDDSTGAQNGEYNATPDSITIRLFEEDEVDVVSSTRPVSKRALPNIKNPVALANYMNRVAAAIGAGAE